MNIRDLAALTGVAERQIRYLISEDLIPRPSGGRSNAEYGDDHVAAIRRYLGLRERGFRPAEIKVLLEAGKGAPIAVAPGVTLVVDPKLFGSGAEIGPVVERIAALLKDIVTEKVGES